jgi:NADPH:quinone reductase-like Zn-dependent oxidoreductase
MEQKVTHTARWTLPTQNGIESLKYEENAPIPDLGEDDVLVEMHAASINYRDLVITKVSSNKSHVHTRFRLAQLMYQKSADNFPISPSLIPGSDGSGVIRSVGPHVNFLKPGGKIVTHMVPSIGSTTFPTMASINAGIGEQVNGTLTQYAVLPQSCLVRAPKNLSFEQAATLPCSGLTAWNACMGLKGRELEKGDWLLVQGSGGVSVAALQVCISLSRT